jgi:hypothetical protein
MPLKSGMVIAPRSARAFTAPAVGIFWRVDNVLVIDRSTLAEAEAYGDCLTHAAGHYERWQEWQALGGTTITAMGYPTRIAFTEYDEWPRGRIVYETPAQRFVLYADRRLWEASTVAALKVAFGLGAVSVLVTGDSHYQ